MAATDAMKQAVANYVGTLGADISLHGADPGTTGANEIAGGGYARKTTAWGAAAIVGGNAVITGSTVQFDVEAGDAALWYGVWNGATFRYGRPLTPGVTINAAGNGKVDVIPTYTYAQT
ncbi:hypothetical protein [Mycobacterium aquaticum]|uniref:Uncharacterized protein n=1 Tax=Mycobacterium aquaticum TaxID=1927124 RepID=A0A1X0A4U8_9MYCO|nr:hypothetical protein [Mycobacterium aquaticum]ORA24885.1 hypothetical protein BST13_33450 [Mycobacterium aquaticum]